MEAKKKRAAKKPKKKKVRIDADVNGMIISDAFFNHLLEKQKVPSYSELARQCKVSVMTVRRHLTNVKFDDVKAKFRAVSDKVLAKLTVKAIKMDNHQFARLYFEVVEGLGEKKKVEMTGENGQPIKQETVHKVIFEDNSEEVSDGSNKPEV